MPIILRPYQERAIELLGDAYRAGHRRILIQSPTGTGKGTLIAQLLANSVSSGAVSLFCVHRRELVHDLSHRVGSLGVRHATVLPGENYSNDEYCFIGSVQSMVAQSRRKVFSPSNVKLIICDEAHHFNPEGGQYKLLADMYPNALFVGFSATPMRMDGSGLGNFFTHLIQAISFREAFEAGYLVRPRYFAPFVPNLKGVSTRGGDFDEAQLEEIMNSKKLVGDLVEHYARYAIDRQGVVFATRVKHSLAIVEAFSASGFVIAHLDGKTDKVERDEIMTAFSKGEIQLLSSVGVLTEGVDVPATAAVVLARPSKSPIYHLQSIGRALRPAPGKEDAMVLDHAGNVLRLGMIDDYDDWTLDTGKNANGKTKDKEAKQPKDILCEGCGTVFRSSKICPACGLELVFTLESQDIEVQSGELAEYLPHDSPRPKVFEMSEKLRWLSELLWVERSKGFRSGWAANQYREKFSVWPAKVQGVAPSLPGAEVLAHIDARRRAYLEQRKREQQGFDAPPALPVGPQYSLESAPLPQPSFVHTLGRTL